MELKNKFYSIGEVAEILNVNQSKVRYWEKEFSKFVKPRRSRRGDRMFTVSDIENLKLIKYLVEEIGLTLAGAKNYMQMKKKALEAKVKILERLQSAKQQLEQLRDSL